MLEELSRKAQMNSALLLLKARQRKKFQQQRLQQQQQLALAVHEQAKLRRTPSWHSGSSLDEGESLSLLRPPDDRVSCSQQ